MWVSMRELEELIGEEKAYTLANTRAGVATYIPKTYTGRESLVDLVGLPAATTLAKAFGGEYVMLPNVRKREPKKREVLELLASGKPQREIALALDVTQRYVEQIAVQKRETDRQLTFFP